MPMSENFSMKILRFLPVLIVLPILPSFAEEAAPRTIEVTGKAIVKAEVDRVIWRISLRGTGATLEEAAANLAEVDAHLEEKIAGLKLPGGSLRMSRVRSGREYERRPNGSREFVGYYAERGGLVRTEQIELSEKIESVLLSHSQLEITGLELESSKMEELKRQAGKNAVMAARQKAADMAGALDAQLGEILMIQEGGGHQPRFTITENRVAMPVFDGSEGPSFEEIEIESTVTLRFALQQES